MAEDPVCGMQVDEDKAPATCSLEDKTYYFCSTACKEEFEKSPDKYIETEKINSDLNLKLWTNRLSEPLDL